MSYDRTYCGAKCVNSLCEYNRIKTAGAPEGVPLSWTDYSKDCVGYEPTDSIFVERLPLSTLMQKANIGEGLNWEIGEAFHELAFKVVYRITDGERIPDRITQEERDGYDQLTDRLRLRRITWT